MTDFAQGLMLSGALPPGGEVTWLFWPLPPRCVRWLTAQPYIYVEEPGTVSIEHFPPFPDSAVEITQVSQLLKGRVHQQDGTGGSGDLMAFVTIRNVSPDPTASVSYELYMAESEPIL